MRRFTIVAAALALVAAASHTFVGPPAAAAGSPGDQTVVLSGELTAADKGTYQEHPFIVPQGVTRLDVEFQHSHKDAGTQLAGHFWSTFPEALRGHQRFIQLRAFELTEQRARTLARALAQDVVAAWEKFRAQPSGASADEARGEAAGRDIQ